MARTSRAPDSSAPASKSSATSPTRIKKTTRTERATRTTRQSSRAMDHLQSMFGDGKDEDRTKLNVQDNGAKSKGKGKARAMSEPMDVDQGIYADRVEKPFPIMDLPTEIRLEIYRACLTRPYNILLSRREPPPQQDLEDTEKANVLYDSQSDDDDSDDDTQSQVITRQETIMATSGPSASSRRSTLSRRAASRSSRPIRLLSSRSSTGTSTNNASNFQAGQLATVAGASASNNNTSMNALQFRTSTRPIRRNRTSRSILLAATEPPRNQASDPLIINILRASKEIYKEARSVLYSENIFTLDLNTAMSTLACLHQRSRRQIKHVELEIPTYNEILERFQETVRLSLRYCSGLKKFVINMPFTLPGADGSGTTGNTTVYANGFDILRWLPQECDIILRGHICVEIETVVNKHLHLAKTLDKVSYNKKQHMPYSSQCLGWAVVV